MAAVSSPSRYRIDCRGCSARRVLSPVSTSRFTGFFSTLTAASAGVTPARSTTTVFHVCGSRRVVLKLGGSSTYRRYASLKPVLPGLPS